MDIQNLFNVVLNASHDGVLILDNRGILVFVNEATSRFIDRDCSELIGQHFNTLIEKRIFSKRSISMKALQEKRKISALLEIRGQKILTTATPCMNDKNEVEFVVSNVRNLGELDTIAAMFSENLRNMKFSGIDHQYDSLRKKVIKEKIQGMGFPEANFESNAMAEILDIALKIAPLDIPVLIMGESGVGKGLLAKIIHKASFRADRPMVEINASNFPESLIDSELFGYSEGTFTGAIKMGKVGLIETANNSTLFLDEIGAMPLEFQTRLLKFLDDGYILPLGSREKRWINVRVIAATNFDLSKQVADGKFRKDLFYRLTLMPLTILPLRERIEDINILIDVFLESYRSKYQKNIIIEKDSRKHLLNYSYPGNVRELKNIMERLAILAKNNIIDLDILPPFIIQYSMQHNTQSDTLVSRPLRKLVTDYENRVIEKLMTTYKSTYKVAEILGVSQPTIVRKMHRYKNTVNVKAKEHKEG